MPPDQTYEICLKEAIKCHHNDIVDYLLTNKNYVELHLREYIEYDNYERLLKDSVDFDYKPLDLEYLYNCFNDYSEIVNSLIKESYLDVNIIINLELKNYIVFKFCIMISFQIKNILLNFIQH